MYRYFIAIIWVCYSLSAFSQAGFSIAYSSAPGLTAVDGRLLLLISTDSSAEPRFQISDEFNTAQVYGKNVDAWAPGKQQQFSGAERGRFDVVAVLIYSCSKFNLNPIR